MQIGVFSLVMFGALAWGFARVLAAPRWVERAIPFCLLAIMAAGLILLPPEAAFRQSVGGAVRALVFLALASLPILGYRWLLRRLRARSGAAVEADDVVDHPTGFVLIMDDTQLTADTHAARRAEAGAAVPPTGETLSIAHRDAMGAITGSARLRVTAGLAEISAFYICPGARGSGLGPRLLVELESEARRRGATCAALDIFSFEGEAFFIAQGFREAGRIAYPDGPERVYLVKDLP